MLRQILSPSPEIGDIAFGNCCNLQPGIFANYSSMLSSVQHIAPLASPYLHASHSQSLMSLEQTSTLENLEIHMESHPCLSCGLEFRSATKLNYHIRTNHQINTDLRRRYDGNGNENNGPMKYSMQNQQMLTNNMMTMSDTNAQLFSCEHCQATFRYRTLLERHKKMHITGQDKPYGCTRCQMRFDTRNDFNHHAKTHKSIIQTTSGPGTTSNINHSTITTATMNMQLDDKPLDAPVSYPCDSCTKQFLTIESLTSHKAVHRSRPLVCDVCGKGFTHRKYYVVHQRIHTGERPYLCAMCGKSFTQASTLTVHRRYHTGERPYTCTLCGKGFVTRTIMLNHMKKH